MSPFVVKQFFEGYERFCDQFLRLFEWGFPSGGGSLNSWIHYFGINLW